MGWFDDTVVLVTGAGWELASAHVHLGMEGSHNAPPSVGGSLVLREPAVRSPLSDRFDRRRHGGTTPMAANDRSSASGCPIAPAEVIGTRDDQYARACPRRSQLRRRQRDRRRLRSPIDLE